MGVKLFKTADERIEWLLQVNPRAVITDGFSEWYEATHGVKSCFSVGQRVSVLYFNEEWADVMTLSGNLALMMPSQYVRINDEDIDKPIWG